MMSIKYHDNTTPEQYGPDGHLLDNWDAGANWPEREYIRVYFRLDSDGFDGMRGQFMTEAERAAFYDRAHDALADCGFAERDDEGKLWRGCRVHNGKADLFIHPQNISGTIFKNDVRRIAERLDDCAGIKLRWVDVYETVHDMPEAEYCEYLDSKREEIKANILKTARTQRSNLYKSRDSVIKAVADRVRLKRIGCDYYIPDRTTTEFINGFIDRLEELGYIVTATGRGDVPLVRTINKTEQKKRGLHIA